ncbi:MAG: hypothetical protein GF347_05550 [Candidatus Moranbacteria bacterium]|nr:hypothetical protein [Candidatus Moranbacteria bacterium]
MEQERPIDKLVKNSVSWWGSDFTLIKRTKIKNWQAVIIVAFIAGALAAVAWSIAVEWDLNF